MKKEIALLIGLFGLLHPVFSQHKTYLGGGVSVTNDKYALQDSGDELRMGVLLNGTYNVTVSHELNKMFLLETGFIGKDYSEGFLFKGDYSNASSGSIFSWQFPLRLKTRFNIYQEKIFFTTTAGYVLGVNKNYFPGSGCNFCNRSEGAFTLGNTSYTFSSASNYNYRRHFSMVQAGLGIDFVILKKLNLILGTSYFAGFSRLMQMNISYEKGSGNGMHSAKVIGKGNYWNYGIGLSYPISDLL